MTPSVSRPNVSRPSPPKVSQPIAGTRPATGVGTVPRPGTGAIGAGSRPSNAQLQNFLDLKPAGGNISTLPANRPGNAASDFLQNRPSTLPANRPGVSNPIAGTRPGVGDRPGVNNRANIDHPIAGRPDRIQDRQDRRDNRFERRDEVRDQIRDNHPRLDFWADHPNWARWRINTPYRWAAWGAITGWCTGYGWSEPVDYAYGENVYYDDGQVYYGDTAVATEEEYAQQAEQIAESAPEVAADKAEWLPLGVFALTPDGEKSGPSPTLFLQLAISKDGVINGLLHNTATDSTQEIEGMADKSSQRAAWTGKGKSRPIMETGVSSLTQDTAPALIHFADGTTQQWLMVRLEDPAMPMKK